MLSAIMFSIIKAFGEYVDNNPRGQMTTVERKSENTMKDTSPPVWVGASMNRFSLSRSHTLAERIFRFSIS